MKNAYPEQDLDVASFNEVSGAGMDNEQVKRCIGLPNFINTVLFIWYI